MNKAPSSLLSLVSVLLGLAAVGSAAQAQAVSGDVAKGAAKAAMCIGCHGIVGYQASFPEVHRVPMIAGQGAPYIVASLVAYQKGERKHPTMRGISASLSEQDMADLAAFYAQQGKDRIKPAPATPARAVPEALKDRMAACVACHGANYSAPIDPAYPKLAGQHADFLYVALKAYATDNNPQVGRSNATMRSQVVQEAEGKKKLVFTNAELKQMANYLGSLPGELAVVPQSRLR